MNTLQDTTNEIKKNASHVVEGVGHAAETAKSGVVDSFDKLSKLFANVRSMNADDALELAGLQRKSGALFTVGTFAAGFAAGAGASLFFAPSSGADMRKKLVKAIKAFIDSDTVEGVVETVETKAKQIMKAGEDKIREGKHTVEEKAREGKNNVDEKINELKPIGRS